MIYRYQEHRMSTKKDKNFFLRISEELDKKIEDKLNSLPRSECANKSDLLRKLIEIGLDNLK
jgi:hypothetical protein